jgi:hypothetical protein
MRPTRAPQTERAVWRKASLCQGGECVEVARLNNMIVMRDSKDPRGHMLYYATEEFRSFVRSIKAGRYDNLVR